MIRNQLKRAKEIIEIPSVGIEKNKKEEAIVTKREEICESANGSLKNEL